METYPNPPTIAQPVRAEAKPAVLRVDCALTISEAAGVHAALKERLEAGIGVLIDLSGVTAVDLIGLQLLCSAKRTAERAGLPLGTLGAGSAIMLACEAAGLPSSDAGLPGGEAGP